MFIRDLAPDSLVHSGIIHTLDPQQTVAQALAIKDGRIIAIGSDAEILPLAGEHTQHINLQGRCTIPGIFDSHAHLLEDDAPKFLLGRVGTKAILQMPPRPVACPPAGTLTLLPTSIQSF